jgi:hypothetical protein
MNTVSYLMTKLDVAQARSKALDVSNYITSYSVKVMPSLWTKVFPSPEPVQKTAWEMVLAKVQEPVTVPTYLFYLMILVLSLDVFLGLWNVWEMYGTTIMECVSQCKLAQGFLGRCDSNSKAIRNSFGVFWRPIANTAIVASHQAMDVIGKLRSSVEAGLLKVKNHNVKASDVRKDVDKGNMHFKLVLISR